MKLLPPSCDIKSKLSLDPNQKAFIEESRQNIRQILNGTDPRLLLIVGPCSIHDRSSALELAASMKQLAEDVASQFFLVMRTYCEKPRTTAGWKGLLYDPFLDGSDDIETGIHWTRQLFLDLAALQVPTATEFLDPLTAHYYEDCVAWGSIGARTSSSQIHRQLASGLPMPMGIKNGVTGHIASAIQGVLAATQPHSYVGLNALGQPCVIKTMGNSDAHVVLRGGEQGPNYDAPFIQETLHRLAQVQLPLRLLVDCSHGNSGKNPDLQPTVFRSLIEQVLEGNTHIRGLLIESHLFGGHQPLTPHLKQLRYGVSVTDPCLDWHATNRLIEWGAKCLQDHMTLSPNQQVIPDFCYSP